MESKNVCEVFWDVRFCVRNMVCICIQVCIYLNSVLCIFIFYCLIWLSFRVCIYIKNILPLRELNSHSSTAERSSAISRINFGSIWDQRRSWISGRPNVQRPKTTTINIITLTNNHCTEPRRPLHQSSTLSSPLNLISSKNHSN